MRLLEILDTKISNLFDRWYWCCRHRWCFRECTYQYRCYRHQDDP